MEEREMGIIWTIIIGFIAGVIPKFIMPGPNEPQGFILTAILGIVGAFVASFLGQMLGWYGPGRSRLDRRGGRRDHRPFCVRVLRWPESGLTGDRSANPTSQYSIEERADSGNGSGCRPISRASSVRFCAREGLAQPLFFTS